MATRTWKGYINFGLLSIPVGLCVCARDSHVALKNLHKKCNAPLNMPKICSACKEQVTTDQIVKGYENGDGYVLLNDDELDSILPATEKVMEISETVKWSEVSPHLLAESFYVLPEPPGVKAYTLLQRSLVESGRVALAQLTKNNREHIVLIRPHGTGLMLHMIWYAKEVAQVPEFINFKPASLAPDEVKLAKQLVDSLADKFEPDQFENGYDQRLTQLVSSKLDKTVSAPTPIKPAEPTTIDLMAALQKSIKRRRAIAIDDDEPPKTKRKKAA